MKGLSWTASWRPGPSWISTQFRLDGQTWELSSVSFEACKHRGALLCGLEGIWEMWAGRRWLYQRFGIDAALGRNGPRGPSPIRTSGRAYCLLEWTEHPAGVKWHISLIELCLWASISSSAKHRWWSQLLKLGCRVRERLYVRSLNFVSGVSHRGMKGKQAMKAMTVCVPLVLPRINPRIPNKKMKWKEAGRRSPLSLSLSPHPPNLSLPSFPLQLHSSGISKSHSLTELDAPTCAWRLDMGEEPPLRNVLLDPCSLLGFTGWSGGKTEAQILSL